MNEEQQPKWIWPARVEQIDPYPWHGLCYSTEFGSNWIRPSGGRPAVPLPARIARNGVWLSGPPEPDRDGVLWDIGRPDPPFSQALWDAGAESISRRLVSVGSGLIRINGKTKSLVIRSIEAETYSLETYDGGGGPTIPVADFVIPWSQVTGGVAELVSPSGQAIQLSGFGPPSHIARSRDGSRVVLRSVASYPSSAPGHDNFRFYFITSLVELHITADAEWNWSVGVSIISDLKASLGSYTYERISNLKETTIDRDDGSLSYEAIPPDARVSPSVTHGLVTGSITQTLSHTGRVVSAYYDASDALQIVRCDQSHIIEDVSDAAGSYADKAPGDNLYMLNRWRVQRTGVYRRPLRYYIGASEISVEFRRDIQGSVNFDETFEEGNSFKVRRGTVSLNEPRRVLGTPAEYLNSSTLTDGEITDRWFLSVSLPAPAGLSKDGTVYAPVELGFAQNLTLGPAKTESHMVFGFVARDGYGTYITPVLSPGGVSGALVSVPVGAIADESAAYNPLTGETVRDIDHPDITILGFM